MTDRLQPEFLSHYRVLSKLGAGGMGDVYLGEDTRLARKVAIKVLPVELTRNAENVRRFIQEAKAASALNHPNIVTVHDVGEDGEGRGTCFRQDAALGGRDVHFPVDPGAAVLADGQGPGRRARGRNYSSRRETENIMVRDDGYVKVLDFGIARLTPAHAADADAATQQTSVGQVMGTVKYMSPEQARGETTGPPSDIFSLGIVFYELAADVIHLQPTPCGSRRHLGEGTDSLPARQTEAALRRNLRRARWTLNLR